MRLIILQLKIPSSRIHILMELSLFPPPRLLLLHLPGRLPGLESDRVPHTGGIFMLILRQPPPTGHPAVRVSKFVVQHTLHAARVVDIGIVLLRFQALVVVHLV